MTLFKRRPDPGPDALSPQSYADVFALFDLLCETMRDQIVGCEVEIDRLALLGVRHLTRDRTGRDVLLRALITGPRASGKSTLARIFAESLCLPYVTISASALAEMNWSGADLGDFLGLLYDSRSIAEDTAVTVERAERAVVIVDGLEALRLPGRYGSASSRDYQLGRQQGLGLLMEGGVIPIERGTGSVFWPSHRALVIGVGTFDGVPDTAVSAEGLIDWGMIPSLAGPLCGGTVLTLPEAVTLDTAQILERNLRVPKAAFAAFGYQLTISPEVLTFVADSMRGGRCFSGVREAVSCIALSAEQVLVALVRSGAPVGTHHLLAPDDIRLPQGSPRGMWRE